MHAMKVREVDPAPQCGLLQEVIEVVGLAQEQQHVQRIVEPGRGAGHGQEDHGE